MKVMQIGNGGAFDYDKTNSSFLIDFDDGMLLFDCGYNVFAKLRKLDSEKIIDLKNLKRVFISHMDDDHMGSLKSLIYYQYFMNKVIMDVECARELQPVLKEYLSTVTGYMNYGVFHKDTLFNLKCPGNFINETFKTNHHVDCYGIVVHGKNENICITGDTKAIPYVLEKLDTFYNFVAIYHDYSNWNMYHQQVHCCEEDFNWYSEKIRNKIIKYHTGEEYNKEWKEF